ncbi:MAG: YbaB/EbfC family nucleoid-associated protein [Actinobacteria bacterium]|nr:YbaB/EbfC family nucleoid-associated protein [Actinomycetota bacterium]MCL5888009.1 YbaB/EbfC family nucleoid-associated protein [Actinomycetota bacterium]
MKPNMGNMLKQAQKMQQDMARVQAELAEESVEASVGGGMVKVVMTGDLSLKGITIDPAAMDPDDVTMLEDMIVAAVGEATRQAQELASRRMSEVTGGLNIPGLM